MADTDADTPMKAERADSPPAASTDEPAPTNGVAHSADAAASEAGPLLELSPGGTPEDCPRCGSMLPDGDEGICPTCGSPFGFKTQQMATVTPEILARHGYASQAPQSVPDTPSEQEQAPRRARTTAIALLVAVLVLAGLLIAVLLSGQ